MANIRDPIIIEDCFIDWSVKGGGKPKNINNDKNLIEEAIRGLQSEKYRSYRQAAIDLASKSLTWKSKSVGWQRVGSTESIVSRLSRAISREYRAISKT